MDIIFSIVLFMLVLFFLLSNPRNKVNQWCAVAGFIFWLGIAKEAALYSIIPRMENAGSLAAGFMPVYNVCTWALYSLAMPTIMIFALYFCGFEKRPPKRRRLIQSALYVPALFITFFYSPLAFKEYQLNDTTFWAVYGIYNLSAVIIYAFLMIRGVRLEKPGKQRKQKIRVMLVILPPVVFWATSVFPAHFLQMQGLLKLWQLNAIFLLIGLIILVVMAFKDGFMGLRLSGETYNWNTNMNLISTGAEYTSHMLKNQTAKMELCIEQLNSHFQDTGEKPPEELAILTRSLTNQKNYIEKIKHHSQSVNLLEESCKLAEMLADATSISLAGYSGITMNIGISENVFWVCDKSHMTEVFSNIIINAIEAMRGSGAIEVIGAYNNTNYLLRITDTGIGITGDELHKVFIPYFTTKSTEKNFGLGLAYCKNVITKHGGSISAESRPDKGTTITIALPSKRVAEIGNGTGGGKDV